jgi:hypothetical protein
VILTWGHCAGGRRVAHNVKDIVSHPDSLALTNVIMRLLVLVCANMVPNYAHLADLDAFFASPE